MGESWPKKSSVALATGEDCLHYLGRAGRRKVDRENRKKLKNLTAAPPPDQCGLENLNRLHQRFLTFI